MFDDLLTLAGVIDETGYSPVTICRDARAGELLAIETPAGRLFHRAEVERWFAAKAERARTDRRFRGATPWRAEAPEDRRQLERRGRRGAVSGPT